MPPTVAVQQPFAQVLESHKHWPPEQCWPAPQAAPLPHLQVPLAQLSAFPAAQATQAFPAGAQALTDSVVQTLPLQHPVGHEVASHTHWFPLQRWPAPQVAPLPQPHTPLGSQRSAFCASQVTQAPPSTPHEVELGVGLQVVPMQQPVGHDDESHTH